ncbi:hypothetical protein TYRP_011472 [Tyrophagus putrescentiae]|nr:hypothetical protein TYRP_011472 [Tyrophagus putrescentiae]
MAVRDQQGQVAVPQPVLGHGGDGFFQALQAVAVVAPIRHDSCQCFHRPLLPLTAQQCKHHLSLHRRQAVVEVRKMAADVGKEVVHQLALDKVGDGDLCGASRQTRSRQSEALRMAVHALFNPLLPRLCLLLSERLVQGAVGGSVWPDGDSVEAAVSHFCEDKAGVSWLAGLENAVIIAVHGEKDLAVAEAGTLGLSFVLGAVSEANGGDDRLEDLVLLRLLGAVLHQADVGDEAAQGQPAMKLATEFSNAGLAELEG